MENSGFANGGGVTLFAAGLPSGSVSITIAGPVPLSFAHGLEYFELRAQLPIVDGSIPL